VTDDDEVQVPRSNVLEGSRALWECTGIYHVDGRERA